MDSTRRWEYQERLKAALARWDAMGTGLVSGAALKGVLMTLNSQITEVDVDNTFSVLGTTSSGEVPYARFVDFLYSEEAPSAQKPANQQQAVVCIKQLKDMQGNLCYTPQRAHIDEAITLVDRAHENAGRMDLVLENWGKARKWGSAAADGQTLMFVYTDLEPDDTMAIAQLWQWSRETEDMQAEPLVSFCVDFAKKDACTIFEKKLLVAELMLGLGDFHILTHEGDTGTKPLHDPLSTPHPATQRLAAARENTVTDICTRIAGFEGERINFYIMAPGRGNLGAIYKKLKNDSAWPLKAKWSVHMYSGTYNMKGMTEEDIVAIEELSRCGDSPLADLAKFPFFGGRNCHPWTESLTTFALPEFAKDVSMRWPLLAAALKLLNNEMNQSLIAPDNNSLFRGSELVAEEQARFAHISSKFVSGDFDAIQVYAKALIDDTILFPKVAGFKQSTVRAFAFGGCDSPLCDQLIFLHIWMRHNHPSWLAAAPHGSWCFDQDKGFTSIKVDGAGTPGIQPTLATPKDEECLTRLRHTMHTYFLRHMDALDRRNAG